MNSRYKSIPLTICALFLFLSLPLWAATPEPPNKPTNYIVDLAGIIGADVERNMNAYLRELEVKTTAQVVVLTIKSLDGESIDGFSLRMAEKWKLGQKDKDNGVLITVALSDRKYRFEVGYGLEGVLPDSLVGTIGRQYLVPNFREGNYAAGVTTATLAVIKKIADSAGVEISGMPRMRQLTAGDRGKHRKPTLIGSIFTILFFIGLIYLFIRNPRLFMLFLMFSMMGGRRSGWGGGGGFGGGGFGGGGGGGFGGGGASGGW